MTLLIRVQDLRIRLEPSNISNVIRDGQTEILIEKDLPVLLVSIQEVSFLVQRHKSILFQLRDFQDSSKLQSLLRCSVNCNRYRLEILGHFKVYRGFSNRNYVTKVPNRV